MAGNGRGRGGTRSSGGTTSGTPRQMTAAMVDRGIKATYKAQGEVVNDRLPARLPYSQREGKRERMSARLRARRDTLFATRRKMERQEAATKLRALRRVDPAAARYLAATYRKTWKSLRG